MTVSKNGKVKKMLFVITIWVLCITKGGALNLLTWLKGGYLKNMGAISGGPEKIWNKKQFLLHSPLQLKLWLVPKARRAKKNFLETGPPSLSQSLDDSPPPSPPPLLATAVYGPLNK